MSITVEIHGFPTPQGSKKAWVNKATGRAQMKEQTSDRLGNWRQDVKAAAFNTMARFTPQWQPIDQPIQVVIEFRFPRPKAHYRTGRNAHVLRDNAPGWPTNRTTGDIEKLIRSTHDALTTAGFWTDDSLVADVHATKAYVTDPTLIGATLTVRPMNSAAPVTSTPIGAADPQGVLL